MICEKCLLRIRFRIGDDNYQSDGSNLSSWDPILRGGLIGVMS